jgi:hypothetical protein
MTLIETMKLALEALEACNRSDMKQVNEAITALRTAIAEAEKQEPVAWANLDQYGNLHESSSQTVPPWTFPVYRHPPAAQRQPLTDEQMYEAVRPLCRTDLVARALVEVSKDEYRAIEAAHGIKEKNT